MDSFCGILLIALWPIGWLECIPLLSVARSSSNQFPVGMKTHLKWMNFLSPLLKLPSYIFMTPLWSLKCLKAIRQNIDEVKICQWTFLSFAGHNCVWVCFIFPGYNSVKCIVIFKMKVNESNNCKRQRQYGAAAILTARLILHFDIYISNFVRYWLSGTNWLEENQQMLALNESCN